LYDTYSLDLKDPVWQWTESAVFIHRKSLKQKLIDLYIEGTHKEPFCEVNMLQAIVND